MQPPISTSTPFSGLSLLTPYFENALKWVLTWSLLRNSGYFSMISLKCLNSLTSMWRLSAKVFTIKTWTISLFLLSWGKAVFNVTSMFHNDVLLNVHLPLPSTVVENWVFPMHGLFFSLLDQLILYHFSVSHKFTVFVLFLVSQGCIWICDFCRMWLFYFSIISVNHRKSPFLLLKMANVTEELLSFLFFDLVSDS